MLALLLASSKSGFPTIITVVGGIIGAVGVIAAAVAVIRANLAQTTIALYREESDALRARLETTEKERDELKLSVETERSAKQAALREKAMMADMVSGATAIKTLGETTEMQHEEVMEAFDKLAAGIATWARGGTPPTKITQEGS